MSEFLKEWWGVILSGVGAVAWLVRLEAHGKENAKEIRRLWNQRTEDREATNEVLKEMRADIKELLRKVGA